MDLPLDLPPTDPGPRAEPAARPGIQVAVVMERVAQPNQWEDYSFRVCEVVRSATRPAARRPGS